MVNGGGYVDVLQMLECLRVEEAKRGPRGEGDPDPDASDDHVRDHHAFFLVRLELVLRKSKRSDEWGSGCSQSLATASLRAAAGPLPQLNTQVVRLS